MTIETCQQCMCPVDTTTDHEFHDRDVNGNRDICVKCRDKNWRDAMILNSPTSSDVRLFSPKINGSSAWYDSGHGAGDFL